MSYDVYEMKQIIFQLIINDPLCFGWSIRVCYLFDTFILTLHVCSYYYNTTLSVPCLAKSTPGLKMNIDPRPLKKIRI